MFLFHGARNHFITCRRHPRLLIERELCGAVTSWKGNPIYTWCRWEEELYGIRHEEELMNSKHEACISDHLTPFPQMEDPWLRVMLKIPYHVMVETSNQWMVSNNLLLMCIPIIRMEYAISLSNEQSSYSSTLIAWTSSLLVSSSHTKDKHPFPSY